MVTPISFGNCDPLVKEIGSVFNDFFSWTGYIDLENKRFVEEFEQKRGGVQSALKTLKQCEQLLSQLNMNLLNSQVSIDSFGDMILEASKSSSTTISLLLPKEKHFQEERENLRLQRLAKEQEEKQSIMKQEDLKRDQINSNFCQKLNELHRQYLIRETDN